MALLGNAVNLAIIPARGGSKRIANKNIKPFCGKPIIAYAIENALKSGIFDEVIVSTDSAQIATIAVRYGAKTPFMRPQALADDHTPTLPVIAHALESLQARDEDFICCLYPATPLLPTHYLTQAHALLCEDRRVRYVFGALAYAHSPWRSFRLDSVEFVDSVDSAGFIESNGRVDSRACLLNAHNAHSLAPTLLHPEFEHTRSQDLAPLYHDAGQFYFARAKSFREQLPIFTPHSRALILNPLHAQDIDTPQDWQLAELKYQLTHPAPTPQAQ
ncbi:cytidylyltransferase domain-containing protein [uncultured Helicobacter sp.]|uniref:cytidylyltransferase domain-containing protein n=1 Tax=uncultured Helicobacter sp. TaxID=175537 RepID=UPI00375191CC